MYKALMVRPMSGSWIWILLAHVDHMIFTKGFMGITSWSGMFSSSRVCLLMLAWLSILTVIILSSIIWMLTLHRCWDILFASLENLVVKTWIRATVLFPSFINLTSTKIWVYVEIFSGLFVYWGPSIFCHSFVALVDVMHPLSWMHVPSL